MKLRKEKFVRYLVQALDGENEIERLKAENADLRLRFRVLAGAADLIEAGLMTEAEAGRVSIEYSRAALKATK